MRGLGRTARCSPTRPLDHIRFPYLFLDATYVKARVEHRIVSQAIVIATGITQDGGREVVRVVVGDSEAEVSGPSSCVTCENVA